MASFLARLLRRGHDEDAARFGIGFEPLEATPEQLSRWREHPSEVRMFRHTEATAKAFKGKGGTAIAPAAFAFRLPFDLPVPDGAAFGLRRSMDPSEPMWVHRGGRVRLDS
jgi:hypothetical protein